VSAWTRSVLQRFPSAMIVSTSTGYAGLRLSGGYAGTVISLQNLAETTAHSPARLTIMDVRQTLLAVEMMSKNNNKLQAQLFH
jgi:hypothetical protein